MRARVRAADTEWGQTRTRLEGWYGPCFLETMPQNRPDRPPVELRDREIAENDG